MTTLSLRPYQVDAVEAAFAAWERGCQRPAQVMATGAGKTVVFARIAELWVQRHRMTPQQRVLIVVHREELAEQARAKVAMMAPHLRVGIVQGDRDNVTADVVVAMAQTLRSARRRERIAHVGLVIVDECFPAGTRVGDKSIEELCPGDLVPSWDEETGEEVSREVVRVMHKAPSAMVRVTFANGTRLECTPNHPLLTARGWQLAGWLSHGDSVVSFTHDTTARSALCGVRESSNLDSENEDRYLSPVGQDVLPGQVPGRVDAPGPVAAYGEDQSPACFGEDDRPQSDAPGRDTREDGRDSAGDCSSPENQGWQRKAYARTSAQTGGGSWLGDRGEHRPGGRGAPLSLQGGHSPSFDEGTGGSGRGVSLLAGPPGIRPAPGRKAVLLGVADVQILEPGGDGTYGGVCPGGLVYNIEVAGTHTYLVNDGIVAHNCHHATAETYRMILDHYGCFGGATGARALGVTATMVRGDKAALGDVWQDVIYVRETLELVRDGFLVPPRGKLVQVDDLDLSRVRKQAGDYSNAGLGAALEQSLAPQAVARAYTEHASDRQGILFAPTVHCAQIYGDALAEQGFKSELVHGEMASGLRRGALDNFRAGDTQVLVNCMVLTEGTDLPMASAVVVGRPTKSQGLFTQMAGRGLRLWPGKSDALILVVAGKAAKHSLVAPVELFGEELPELGVEKLDQEEEVPDQELFFELDPEKGEGFGGMELPDWVDGTLKTVELDLFHASKSAWLRTYGGIWFLSAGERLIVIKPEDNGTWGVVWCHKSRTGPSNTGWIAQGVTDMGYAMAFAEANVSHSEKMTASRESFWRAKRPSEKQVDLAARLGLLVTENMRSGEVGSMISVHLASRRIDPYLVRR